MAHNYKNDWSGKFYKYKNGKGKKFCMSKTLSKMGKAFSTIGIIFACVAAVIGAVALSKMIRRSMALKRAREARLAKKKQPLIPSEALT